MPRTAIRDFELANPIYKNASVSFYTVANGVKTATLATLYSGVTGSTQLANPQKLNSHGQFKQPVYIDAQVIGTIVGISVPGHDTAIHSPSPTFRVQQSTGKLQYSYDGGLTFSDSGDSIFVGRGDWVTATDYARNDVVLNSGTLYISLVAHTAGVFATDLAADKWMTAISATAGTITFDSTASYNAGTIGKWLTNLLSSIGSTLVGFIQSGAGAVARLVQDELRTVFRPEQFGATGDGATDDTDALLAMIAACPAAGFIVEFGAGKTYRINADNVYGLNFDGKGRFHLRGNNATIKVLDNESTGVSARGMSFQGVGCQYGVIENLILDGNRANRVLTDPPQACYGVHIGTNAKNLTFKNVRSIGWPIDGFIVMTETPATPSSIPTDILIDGVYAGDNFRNNMSIIDSVRLKVLQSRFIGANGAATGPGAGIDVEPDAGSTSGNQDLLIEDCEFTDNGGPGLVLTGSAPAGATIRSIIRNIKGQNNGTLIAGHGLLYIDNVADLVVDGVYGGQHTDATMTGAVIRVEGGTDIKISNVHLFDSTVAGANNAGVWIDSMSGYCSLNNIRVDNHTKYGIVIKTQVVADGLVVNGCASNPILVESGGANSTLRNIGVNSCVGPIAVYVADVTLENVTSYDSASTVAHILFGSGGTSGILRNATLRQSTSIPVGAVGVYWVEVPRMMVGVSALSAGVDYSVTTVATFTAGKGSAIIANNTPIPA